MTAHTEGALYGREPELAAVDRLVAEAGEGDGRLLLLEGPPGIGKTELLEAARERARGAGWRVLTARADELESAYSYGVVRQWLEREWASAGDEQADAAGLVLSRTPAPAPVGEDATFGIVHALYLFVSELSFERPLLLALDDAQWADPESLRFLAYLQRRLEGLAIAVVVAARHTNELLGRVRDGPRLHAVTLTPLTEPACARLLERAFGAAVEPRFSRACHTMSGGNPLYLVELQRALAREDTPPLDQFAGRVDAITPAALAQHVLRRLAAAGPEASHLAGAMSILGDGGSLRHAALMADVEPRRAAIIGAELVRLAILAGDDPIRFVHPLLRRIIDDHLTSVEREDWHLEAARLLLESRAQPERAAGHLLQTRPGARDWCVVTLREAARQALLRSAPEAAVEYLRRAMAEPPERADEPAVLRELGNAEAKAHDPQGIDHLARARSSSEDAVDRAEIALELAAAHLDLFESIAACRVIEVALDELGDEHPGVRVRLEAALAANAWLEAETVPAGLRVLGKHWDDPPPGAPGRAILAQKALAMRLAGQPAAEVHAAAASALEGVGEDDLRATFEAALSVLVISEGFSEATDFVERVAEIRTVRLVRRRLASLELLRGWLALRLGALGDAELHLRQGLELTPAATSAAGWLVARGLLASVLVSQARLDDAERVLADLPAEPWPVHVATTFALAARAGLRTAQGRMNEALGEYAKFDAIVTSWRAPGPAVHELQAEAAVTLAALGRDEEARALAAEALQRARPFGAPVTMGAALRAAGIAEGGPAGIALLREAVAVLDESPALVERARAQVELGAALRRANQRRAAREHLDAGLRLAQRCGANLLARRAYDELAASGKRLRAADLLDRDELTPTELRIARHAVQGLTNREIAGTLYLSIKTVEMHLGRTYRKLDITARGELAEALRRRG